MQTLGKYQLIAEIARGGMGIVYLAVASGLAGFSKLFVIKELKPELVDDAAFFDMFLEEARLAARLSHPNIVTTYEVGVDGRRPFIVMDYLDGESLGRVLKKKSSNLTTAMHLRILCHALDGLDYAHHLQGFDGNTASIVHRDISPQNVFVTFDGQVKIVDFGIAKASDTVIETQAGTFKGKPGYMAPEQLSGEVDPRADVYSVGVMIWEAVAGRPMWPSRNQIETLTALIKGEIPKLGDVVPDAPEALKRICDKATAKDPDERFATARDLRDALEAYLQAETANPTMREISAVIATMFEPQRRKLRGVLEKCIAEAKAGVPVSKLPSLAPPPLESSTPRPSEHGFTPGRLAMAAGSLAPQSGASSSFRPLSRTPVSQATPDAAMLHTMRAADPSTRRGGIVLGLAIALFALVGVASFFALRTKKDVDMPMGAAAAAVGAPPSTTSSSPLPEGPDPRATAAAPTPVAIAVAPPASETAPVNRPVVTAAPPAPVRPRVVYTPPPPPPRPAVTPPQPTTAAAAAAEKPAPSTTASKLDCNPPFYFEGTKKVFKPGCL